MARLKPKLEFDEEELETDGQDVDCQALAADLSQTLVIDVRGADFIGGHIPGAVRLPFDDVLLDPKRLEAVLYDVKCKEGGAEGVAFVCMHGEPKSKLCAEALASILLEHQQQDSELIGLKISFLAGGMHRWVNRFVTESGEVQLDMLTGFDPSAWQFEDTDFGALAERGCSFDAREAQFYTHVSNADLTSLLSIWGDTQEIWTTLRRAKPLLVNSETTIINAVDDIARYHLHRVYPDALHPDEILLEDKKLGSGAQGIVVRAKHVGTDCPLAVKIVNVDDQSQRAQLINTLSLSLDPLLTNKDFAEGILQLRSMFVRDQKVYLAMNFMDLGGTRTLLEWQDKYCKENNTQIKGLPELVVQMLAKQTIVGLHTLQKRHAIHRDIKPDNILVNSKGEACIADFGISVVLEGENSGPVAIGEGVNYSGHSGVVVESINRDGSYNLKDRQDHRIKNVHRQVFSPKRIFRATSFVGTQAYISPQMAKNSGVSVKEDVWAFGIMLYEWSTGEHPFQEHISSPGELFGSLWDMMAEKEGIELPAEVRGVSFSKELRELVAKCLRKRPSERPTAADLLKYPFISNADASSTRRAWNDWLAKMGKAPPLEQRSRTVFKPDEVEEEVSWASCGWACSGCFGGSVPPVAGRPI